MCIKQSFYIFSYIPFHAWPKLSFLYGHINHLKSKMTNYWDIVTIIRNFDMKIFKIKNTYYPNAILYIKVTVVSVCVGSAWKILPITTCSLWSFPRCNFLDVTDSRKKRNQGSLIFWGKRFDRPKKKYLGLGQPIIFFFFFFCIDQDYLFFILAIVRPD
jgi:hypothetical protein